MKKALVAILCAVALAGGCNFLGTTDRDANGDGRIDKEEQGQPESPWVGILESIVGVAGPAAGPVGGTLSALLLAMWMRQKKNVRALVAGGETVMQAAKTSGPVSAEAVKVLMREGQANYGAGESLYKDIAKIKDEIRAAKS